MNKNFVIVFPRGGGGSWLASTIGMLESDQRSLPQVNRFFDHVARTHKCSFDIQHKFELDQNGQYHNFDFGGAREILFSTACAFNLYINDAIKVKFNPELDNLIERSIIEQFFTLSDNAIYLITDQYYQDSYYKNINLNYKLLFQNPINFIGDLFDLLNEFNVSFDPDWNFALDSIDNYRRSCPNPTTIVDNYNNILWVAWTHAICTVHNIKLTYQFDQATTLKEISNQLIVHRNTVLSLSEPWIFYWNEIEA